MRPRTPPACVHRTSHRRPQEGRNARALADTRPTPQPTPTPTHRDTRRPHHRARRSRPRKEQDCVSPRLAPPEHTHAAPGVQSPPPARCRGTRPGQRCKCPARPSRKRRRGAGAPRPPPTRAADGPQEGGARRTGPPQGTPPASTPRGGREAKSPPDTRECLRGAPPGRATTGATVSGRHPRGPSDALLGGGVGTTPLPIYIEGEGLPYAQSRLSAWPLRRAPPDPAHLVQPLALTQEKNTSVTGDPPGPSWTPYISAFF